MDKGMKESVSGIYWPLMQDALASTVNSSFAIGTELVWRRTRGKLCGGIDCPPIQDTLMLNIDSASAMRKAVVPKLEFNEKICTTRAEVFPGLVEI